MSEENRETFFKRLEPVMVPSEILDVQLAYTLAKFGHRSQVRKELGTDGEPQRYFEHVRRVAIILMDEVRVMKRDLVIAALLHDGIEDTRDITPQMIEHVFGADVALIVMTLSKAPKEGYLERFTASTDWRAYLIKACDRLDNLRSLKTATPEFQDKQIRETRSKYYPLFERMLTLTPAEHLPRAQRVRDLVIQATERQAAFLEIATSAVTV